MVSASTTMSAVIRGLIDQPTTAIEQVEHDRQDNQPAAVQ